VKTIIAAMAVVGALVTAPLSHASASPITCEGFMSGVIDGDLVVPTGATCILGFESRVLGDVTVEEGATFRGEAVIEGDVTVGADGIFATTDGAVGGDIVCAACDRLTLVFMWDPTFEITSTGDISVTGVSDGHIAIEGWRIKNLDVSGSSGSFTFIEFQASGNVVFADNVGNTGFWRVSSRGAFEVVGNTAVGEDFPPTSRLSATRRGRISSSQGTPARRTSKRTSPARTSRALGTTRRPRAGPNPPARTSRGSARP
jgi:hypothetical protein